MGSDGEVEMACDIGRNQSQNQSRALQADGALQKRLDASGNALGFGLGLLHNGIGHAWFSLKEGTFPIMPRYVPGVKSRRE